MLADSKRFDQGVLEGLLRIVHRVLNYLMRTLFRMRALLGFYIYFSKISHVRTL